MTLELGQREKETSREEEREENVGVVVGLGKWAREIHISLLGWQTGRRLNHRSLVPSLEKSETRNETEPPFLRHSRRFDGSRFIFLVMAASPIIVSPDCLSTFGLISTT